MNLSYGWLESRLGLMLWLESEKGLCGLYPVDDKGQARVAYWVGQDFKQVKNLTKTENALLEKQLVRFLTEPKQKIDYPLDLAGTDFQQTVWRALLEIPFGEVWTYTQLAQYLGKPKAIRAAASACAKNKLALVVPCHRVIGKNGGLGGYRWGLETKQMLLKLEQSCLQSEQ